MLREHVTSVLDSLDLKNQAYNVTLFVLSIGFSLLMVKLVTSHLDPAEYGRYQYVLSVVGLASITVLPGISAMLSSYIAKGQHGVVRQLNAFSLKTGILGVVLLVGVAGYKLLGHGDPLMAILTGFAALVFLPRAIFPRYEAILAGLQRFRDLLLIRTVSMGTLYLTGAAALLAFNLGFVGFGITQLAVETVLSWLFYVFASRRLQNDDTNDGAVRHGVVLSAIDAGSTLLLPVLNLYVNATLGPTALGLLVVARRISEQAGGVVKPLMKPVSIKLTRQGADAHTAGIFRLIPLALLLGGVLYGCLVLGISAVGPLVVAPAYRASLEYAKIFGLILLISPLYVLFNVNLVFEGRNWALGASSYAEQSVRLVGYLAFVRRFGIPAIALVNVAAMAVQIAVMLFYLTRYADSKPSAPGPAPVVEMPEFVSGGGSGHA